MSDIHRWHFLRRIICVALAYAGFATAIYGSPAFAVESNAVRTANQVTDTSVATALSVANTVSEPSETDLENEENSAPAVVVEPSSLTSTVPDMPAADEPFLPLKTLSSEPAALDTAVSSDAPVDIDSLFKDGVIRTLSGDLDFGQEEELELIYELRRKSTLLASTSIGIQKGFEYYFPLLDITRLTDIVAYPDFENKRVNGFVATEEATFLLDVLAKSLSSRRVETDLPDDAVIIRDIGRGLGEFYVRLDVLNDLLDLDLVFESSTLTLNVSTDRLLPDELAEQRADKYASLKNGTYNPFAGLNLKEIPNSYRMLSPPAVNLNLRSRYREQTSDLINGFNVSAQHDLLGFRANYAAGIENSTNDGLNFNNARFKLTRRDYGERVLPFGIKRLELGDVSTRPSELIDGGIRGRGITISNKPYIRNSVFDEIRVQGYAQPGWDVELYNGNQLLEYGQVAENGEYIFENVKLRFGRNNIRIVLYGPQGQVEERRESYQISGAMLPVGQVLAEGAIIDANRDLIEVDDRNDFQPKGLSVHGRINTGISQWLSGFATATRSQSNFGTRDYVSVGANFSGLGGAGQVEAYKEIDGGRAIDARYLSSFAGFRFNARASKYKDFSSEDAGFDDNAKAHEYELGLARNLKTFIGNFGLSADYIRTKFNNNNRLDRLSTNISTGRNGVRLSNITQTNINNGSHGNTDGTFIVDAPLSKVSRGLALRTRLEYEMYPTWDMESIDSELRYRARDNKFTSALNVRRNLRDQSTSMNANASYDFGTFLGGVDLGWSENNGYNIGLRMNTSLAPYGPNGEYIARSRSMLGRQRIRGRIFEDANGNGVFDDGDVAIKGAAFKSNRQSSLTSDENGYAVIDGVGDVGPVALTLDDESLADPFLASTRDGYSMIARPTTLSPFLDFPVTTTGTIDGHVYFEDGTAVPGLIIQLVDPAGNVVADTTTAFDGFYTFEFVKPNTYTVRVSPSHQVFLPPETVTVTSDDLFAYGVDLHFVEQAQDVASATDSVGESGRMVQHHHALADEGKGMPALQLTNSGFETTVGAVRVGEHPHKVRLVLDLSGQSSYSISSQDEGHTINIDLPSTAWNANREWKLSDPPLFKNCEALALMSEDGQRVIGSRMRLRARAPLEVFYNAALPPEGDKGERIYIDLIKKK